MVTRKAKSENSTASRARRYVKTTAAVAGLGTKLAGEKLLGINIDRKKHAATLRAALGGLKGPLMKIAQLLGTIPDLVPDEYAREFQQLQADAPPMGWPFVKRRMAAELGADWESKFKSFSRQAAAAASLGQVHKAVDLKGQTLACKLQYPDMGAAVEADLRQLKVISAVFEQIDRAVDTKQVQKELADRLREELDYALEAKHIALYQHMLGGHANVHIPQVVPALSTGRLLTMTWQEGVRLQALEDKPQAARNQVAQNMFDAWYIAFYNFGVIHGDPHLGNYTFRDDLSLNLLDFGCVRVFPPQLVGGVIKLYAALRDNDPDLAVEAYKAWGFKHISKELVAILNIWAGFIYAPLLEDKVRRIDETNTGQYGRATANKVHAELRKIGGVTVPREFVFMDRAAIGLGSVFLRLQAEINWYRQFQAVTDKFDEKTLAKRQHMALKAAGLAS